MRRKRKLPGQVPEARLDAHGAWKPRSQLQQHDATGALVAEVEGRLQEGLAPHRENIRLLETVPGIDRGSACEILVEPGPDLSGFRRTANVAAWAGVAPGSNESSGKRRPGRVRRGNAALPAALDECAHGAVRTKGSEFHAHRKAPRARWLGKLPQHDWLDRIRSGGVASAR